MMRPVFAPTPRPAQENYYASLNDMLVGILFLFILLLTTYALNFRAKEDRLNRLYKERIEQRAALVGELRAYLRLPPHPREETEGILRFDESALFEQSQAVLKPEGLAVLKRLGQRMQERLPCYVSARSPLPCRPPGQRHAILEAVYVEGHTDSLPFSARSAAARDNWSLSSQRAIAAYRALTGADGNTVKKQPLEMLVNASGGENLVGISGYADRRKIDLRHDSPNRRVDLRFILAAPSKTAENASRRAE